MLTSMTITDHIYGGAPFVYEGDLAQGVTQAASLGYDGVELHIADPAAVDAPALEAALRASSLRLTAIGTGRAYVNDGLSLTDADEGRRRAAIRGEANKLDAQKAMLEPWGRLDLPLETGSTAQVTI